jgi:hypothetical protein
MGSLHPHQEQKSPWQHQDLQDDRDAHEEHWEKERRERAGTSAFAISFFFARLAT